MKILISTPTLNLSGGIERVVVSQANYWVNQGNDVIVLVYNDNTTHSFFPIDNRIKVVSFSNYSFRLKLSFIKKIILLINQFSSIKRYFSQEKFDVIISTMHGWDNYLLNFISGSIPIIGVNHVCWYMRKGGYCKSFIKKILLKLKYRLLLFNIKKYDLIVALSKTDHYELKKAGCKTIYIPNACSFVRDNLELLHNNRSKRLIMVGRFDYLKGYDRLVDAWSLMAKSNKDWTLLLVGDGPKLKEIKEKVVQYKLSDQTFFIEKSLQVKELMQQSSIFVMPSRTECCPMVIVEALSCALPVVAFDCESGPRDMIDSYYNGFLIDDNDIVSFANKIQLLISSENLREEMMVNAYNSSKKYNETLIMNRWNDILISLIK